jgi:hypothetical protein
MSVNYLRCELQLQLRDEQAEVNSTQAYKQRDKSILLHLGHPTPLLLGGQPPNSSAVVRCCAYICYCAADILHLHRDVHIFVCREAPVWAAHMSSLPRLTMSLNCARAYIYIQHTATPSSNISADGLQLTAHICN